MRTAIGLTLAAVVLHRWQVVLLGKRSKKPIGAMWIITTDVNVIRRHVAGGGNIGLVCGPASGVAVLDFDDHATAEEMRAALGPVRSWARSGSGRGDHCYFLYQPGLPAKITWRGGKVGEVQRGGTGPHGRPVLQQVVLPPAIHPGDLDRGIAPGGIYRWLVDPRDLVPPLPEGWRIHLTATAVRPSSIPTTDPHGADVQDDSPWGGPPPEELLRRAMQQPGGRCRAFGVKFQCPGCRAEGRDRHMDNALVRLDGRWGCAVDSEHSRAIAVELGVVSDQPQVPTPLRGLSGLRGL